VNAKSQVAQLQTIMGASCKTNNTILRSLTAKK